MAVRGYIVLLRPFFTIAGWEILGRMRWTTGKIIGAIVSTLMVVAAILTIIDTPLGWWNRFGSGVDTPGICCNKPVSATGIEHCSNIDPYTSSFVGEYVGSRQVA